MLRFKKILPVVCATAIIFAGCGSDAPAADNSASGADTGSVAEENLDDQLSAEEEVPGDAEDGQQPDDGAADIQNEADNTEQKADAEKASDNGAKADTSKAATADKTDKNTSSKSDTSKPAASTSNTSTSGSSTSNTSTASSGSTAAAAPAAKPAEPTYKYKDGTYSGSAQGFSGPIGVSVTISKDKITAVSVTSSTDDEPYITEAKAICSHIVSSNSADVSGVSGATYSSNGIKGAVKTALAKAKN